MGLESPPKLTQNLFFCNFAAIRLNPKSGVGKKIRKGGEPMLTPGSFSDCCAAARTTAKGRRASEVVLQCLGINGGGIL